VINSPGGINGGIPIWTFIVRYSSFKRLKENQYRTPNKENGFTDRLRLAKPARMLQLPHPAGEGRGEGECKIIQ
jgi:hypothetical protein